VREAVIKQKDPKLILNELDSLDKLEFDVNNPPPYSAKVIQEKRRKLKDQWSKIYHFYQKEEPKLAYELKQMELDYERRHQLMSQYHESIMQAQKVKLEEIPLPDMEPPPPPLIPPPLMPPQNIDFSLIQAPPPPPPPSESTTPKSILKSSTSIVSLSHDQIKAKLKSLPCLPPGPPSGSPPDLNEFECDDDENELGLSLDDQYKSSDKAKKIRFNDAPSAPSTTNSASAKTTVIASKPVMPAVTNPANLPVVPAVAASNQPKYGSKLVVPPQPAVVAPPPPPPPPSQQYSQRNITQSNQPQRSSYYPPQPVQQQQQQSTTATPATTTIEAKPVLRNKIAEITKFVPTNLIVRREQSSKNKLVSQFHSSYSNSMSQPYNYLSHQQQQYTSLNPLNYSSSSSMKTASVSSQSEIGGSIGGQKSADAAYESFMKEIGDLL
jgi:hypothetical protein